MPATPNLGLPYIDAGQAQKHVTHNEALRSLDTLVQLAVLDRDLAEPPESPTEGARWIVKSGASGAWSGHAGHVAAWQDGAWQFSVPVTGWVAYVADEEILVAWDGGSWSTVSAGGGGGGDLSELQEVALLGIGTTADETNPLSARLNNVLWAAKTVAEGGDGTLRYKMSKESEENTLSLLFQDDFVGCAEIGLTGDDDFHFKVSPDGTNWLESLKIDRVTGRVSFPSGGAREVLTANRIYYIRSDGSDSNDGLSNMSGGAFATIQKAWDTLVTLDLNGFTVTIKLGNTVTLTSGLNASVPPVGGNVILEGDTSTPGNTIISTTSGHAIALMTRAQLTIQYVELRTTTSGYGIFASGPGTKIIIGAGVRFGACAEYQIRAFSGGYVQSSGNAYTISGGAKRHYSAALGGIVELASSTLTLSGTPAFSEAFAYAESGGLISAFNVAFSGSGTGKRYNAASLGNIQTYGGGTNYFPGNASGTGTNPSVSPYGYYS